MPAAVVVRSAMPLWTMVTPLFACCGSALAHVEEHAVRIVELQLTARAPGQQLQAALALAVRARRRREELRPALHELVEVALEGVEALDGEAEMVDRRPLDAGVGVVEDVPGRDDERDAAVGEVVRAVVAARLELEAVDLLVELGELLRLHGTK